MGFAAPMADWLRGEFGHQVEQAVLSSKLLQRGFFNVDYIRAMFTDHRNKRRDTSLYIWTLFNLTSWYDYWIDGVK
jgi:asparagine synthase (glutamine-hydrolysing)